MNFLKKGPEIKIPEKMPELKVPGFLSDIYYELRERHLLPLVVVLVAAIVAVPIALSEASEATDAVGETPAAGSSSSKPTAVVVSKSVTGLRDYRKRLKGLHAKDPFASPLAAAEVSGQVPEAAPEESGGGETGGSAPAPEGGGGTTTVTHTVKYFSWVIDVRIIPVSSNGKPSKSKPTVRNNQPELTMLPGHKTPAAIFIGPSADEKKALMLVSSNVKAIFGDAVCVLGGETCEMIALEPGVPETFVYGANERVFRIELQKIHIIETDKLNKAPLGKPGK